MTKQAFLSLIEDPQPYRYEWRNGRLYAMSGGSGPHSMIAKRVERLFDDQLGLDGPCITYRDRYVEIPDSTPLLPDLVLSCAPSDWKRDKMKGQNSTTIQYPRLIVEVLSEESTGAYDRIEKRLLYQRCPTLDVYMLCSQTKTEITLYKRATNWAEEIYVGQKTMAFPEFQISIALPDIYSGILKTLTRSEQPESDSPGLG